MVVSIKNYVNIIQIKILNLIFFSGHCKKLTPVFDELAAYYKGNMINIAKVDATRFLKATNHFEIRGYPTVKL